MFNNSNTLTRKMIDITSIYPDVDDMIREDAYHHGTPTEVTTYIREEILGPWLMKRLDIKKGKDAPPTLAQYLAE